MYQVDFVAALFGAFLLLWLSRRAGSVGNDVESGVVMLESYCSDDAIAIIPSDAVARCVSPQLLELADPSWGLAPCDVLPLDRTALASSWLAALPSDDDQVRQATGFHGSLLVSMTGVVAGMHFENEGKDAHIHFSGVSHGTNAPGHPIQVVALGIGSTEPPTHVTVDFPEKAWVAYQCQSGLANCGSDPNQLAAYAAAYDGPHTEFVFRIYSEAWQKSCWETLVDVDPHGSPPAKFHECVP